MVNKADLTNLVDRIAKATHSPVSGVGSYRWRYYDGRFMLHRIINEDGGARTLDLGDTTIKAYYSLWGFLHATVNHLGQ